MNELSVHYVGFWWRVLAFIIDSILVSFLLIPILQLVMANPLNISLSSAFLQIILPAIAVIAFWIAKSSTPGKMAIGAEIVDADTGDKPSNRQFIIRYIGYYVSTIPLLLGLLWVAFDSRKQGWHDKLANTVVVFRENSQDAAKCANNS